MTNFRELFYSISLNLILLRDSDRAKTFEQLNNLIFHRRFSDCLEMLEQCGFWGETGLYFIEFVQLEGVQ